MREILFRGKRLCNNKWMVGNLLCYKNGERYICCVNSRLNCYKVDPRSVGQFTGLTDKNGKKIFEGDIVRYPKGEENTTGVIEHGIYRDYHVGFFIEWGESQPCLRRDIAFWAIEREIEIIGNIHDNP